MTLRPLPTIAALLALALSSAMAEKPNVILFMADDMGMGDTSAYQDFTGNSDDLQLHTPNMERLANMGVRFTDAHTPASRCTPTRYGLLTGRYPWRSRLKYWVLHGSQGDPLIEPGRPTLATLFRDQGYATGVTGKWHVGLRYRNAGGKPAAEFLDADLTQPMHTTPLDHGFDFVRITSRSHATSGPDAGAANAKRKGNTPDQNVGPGHIHGRDIVSATDNGRQLVADGPNAYVLSELGGRHSDSAIEFLQSHSSERPFFLYYPANSNHGPHTPDTDIAGKAVVGAGLSVAGQPMPKPARGDYIYENDVALGRLLDYLEKNDDPRRPGSKLIDNTVVIFTSDNGAEIKDKYATGPFRSNKGSCYEGGHRVPFIAAWPAGNVGDGDAATPGRDQAAPLVLTDLFATFADILDAPLPDPRKGERGAEDSVSALAALVDEVVEPRQPLFCADHNDAKPDPAVASMTVELPKVEGKWPAGQWKAFFSPALVRGGEAEAYELYELGSDPKEENNRVGDAKLDPLVDHLEQLAALHRNSGGHRLAAFAPETRVSFDWINDASLVDSFHQKPAFNITATLNDLTLTMASGNRGAHFDINPRGLGVTGGKVAQVDAGEALHLSFDRDVLIESVSIVAGNGVCGGSVTVGDHAPLAIYCIDADNDSKEQQGIISDLGILKAGQTLTLDSRPHLGTEAAGQWRLGRVVVRPLDSSRE